MADRLRRRVNSWMFELPDAEVEATVAEVLALPDPDRPRTGRGTLPVLRFTRFPADQGY